MSTSDANFNDLRNSISNRFYSQLSISNISDTDVGYLELRSAIVERAVLDYKDYKKKIYRLEHNLVKTKSEQAKRQRITMYNNQLKEVMEFFNSSWFDDLCPIDKDTLLKQVDETISRELQASL